LSLEAAIRPFLAVLVLAAAPPGGAPAQEEDPGTRFTGEERVTAVDVVVDFELDRVRRGKAPRDAPDRLAPADFQVLHRGEPRPVVAVETGPEPWTIVVYLEPELTSSYGLAWAADLLAEQVAALTRLGSVEVVVADPAPRSLLAATRDAETLSGVLSQVALGLARFPPEDATAAAAGRTELLAIRAEFLAEALHPTPAVDPEEFARWAAEEEVRLGRLRQDRLLDFLVERAGSEPRRAVVLVSSGYDLSPGDFYLEAVDLDEEAAAAPRLDDDTDALARTLAAYGWIVVPLVPPPPEPEVRPGKRIGKWRLQPGTSIFTPIGAGREAERDEGKAEAYLELGTALRAQGKLEDAEDALEKALHHFYGDPRTAKRQALALLELGAVRVDLGEHELAERTFAMARELDPEQAEHRLGPVVELLHPSAPLDVLAGVTTGLVVREERQLARILEDLGRRVRLTYQVRGLATGELFPVSVSFERAESELVAPGWARSATPRTVAEARVRRMLAGDLPQGDLELRATFEPDAEGSRSGHVTVTFAGGRPFPEGQEALLRVTWAAGAPDVMARVWSSRPEAVAEAPAEWFERHALTLAPDESLASVLVEDLYSGRWGAAVVVVEDPDQSDESDT
jgi:tetratricopeptide (TPR) repeat protein